MAAMLKIRYNSAVGKRSKLLTCIKVAYQIAKMLESRSVGGGVDSQPPQTNFVERAGGVGKTVGGVQPPNPPDNSITASRGLNSFYTLMDVWKNVSLLQDE
jgi:hypothetical protein